MNGSNHRGFALRVAGLPSYARLATAVLIGVVTGIALPNDWRPAVRMVASWDAFALVSLALIWFTIFRLEPKNIRHVARMEDPSRALSLILVLFGASASLLAVVVLLQSTTNMQRDLKTVVVALAITAVALSWLLIHTVFTLRYAHIYHGESADETDEPLNDDSKGDADDDSEGGLDFSGDVECPEYLDFAYFAFTIGMTAQTSDIEVTSQKMRRNVLMHSLLSFGFNTAVVALSIGVLTTLL
ncbi:MAG: DUF1345 domain-containing protein [Gemmatimonadota bacterium]|nr:DUF1345 domain-containing protein [Gemmatimonadota bacterium]